MTDRQPAVVAGFTELFLYFYFIFAILAAIGGALYLVFAPLKAENFIIAGVLIVSTLCIYGFIVLCKLLVDKLQSKLEVGELKRDRINILIGFGGIVLCSGVIRTVVYFLNYDVKISLSLGFLCVAAILFIYHVFVFYPFLHRCTWRRDENKSGKIAGYGALAHVILLIATIRIATEYDNDKRIFTIVTFQILYGLIFGTSSVELLQVLIIGIRFKDRYTPRRVNTVKVIYKKEKKRATPVKPAKQKASDKKEKLGILGSRSICNICLVNFSDQGKHIPRILKECGHTICEGCAESLMKVNFIVCPFCQQKTIVNGPVGTLSKNYALLETMEEVEQNAGGHTNLV